MRNTNKIDAHIEVAASSQSEKSQQNSSVDLAEADNETPQLQCSVLDGDEFDAHHVVGAVLIESSNQALGRVDDEQDRAPRAGESKHSASSFESGVSQSAQPEAIAQSAGGILLPWDLPRTESAAVETPAKTQQQCLRMLDGCAVNADWEKILETVAGAESVVGVWLPLVHRHLADRESASAADARLATLGLCLPNQDAQAGEWVDLFRLLDQGERVLGLQLVHSQWRSVAETVAKFDGLRFVIGHLALPIDLSRAGRAQWSADLNQIARFPGAYLSLSPAALDHARAETFSSRDADGFAALDSFIYQAIDTFGVERCLFASASSSKGPRESVMAAFYRWLQRFSPAEREMIFETNSRTLFGFS